VQLTDPAGYEGGDLQFRGVGKSKPRRARGGALSCSRPSSSIA